MKNKILALVILAILPLFAQAADTLKTSLPDYEWFDIPAMNDFQKGCVSHDPSTLVIKRTGKTFSVNCQTEDGGNVSLTVTPDEGTITAHQTKQMHGPIDLEMKLEIWAFSNGITRTDSLEDCLSKIKKVSAPGKYLDMVVTFNTEFVVSTCEIWPSHSPDPVSKGIKALGNFLSGHQ